MIMIKKGQYFKIPSHDKVMYYKAEKDFKLEDYVTISDINSARIDTGKIKWKQLSYKVNSHWSNVYVQGRIKNLPTVAL